MVIVAGLLMGCGVEGVFQSQDRVIVSEVVIDVRLDPLIEGDTTRARARVLSAAGDTLDTSVGWSSSDRTVATVGLSGLVTAIGGGEVTISAVAANRVDRVELTVLDRVVGVRILTEDARVGVGELVTLEAALTGTGGGRVVSRNPRWGSFDPAIASVSKTGGVRGQSPGRTRIAATIDGVADTVDVIVTPPEPPP